MNRLHKTEVDDLVIKTYALSTLSICRIYFDFQIGL